jgi:predicted metal-binding protein
LERELERKKKERIQVPKTQITFNEQKISKRTKVKLENCETKKIKLSHEYSFERTNMYLSKPTQPVFICTIEIITDLIRKYRALLN